MLIYIAPPSIEVLKERLLGRGTEDLKTIEKRLNIAKEELTKIYFYDYVVINDDIEEATNKVKDIILDETR